MCASSGGRPPGYPGPFELAPHRDPHDSLPAKMADLHQTGVDRHRGVARCSDPRKDGHEGTHVTVLGRQTARFVILCTGNVPPVEVVTRIMADESPEQPLRPPIALTKGVHKVVVVIVVGYATGKPPGGQAHEEVVLLQLAARPCDAPRYVCGRQEELGPSPALRISMVLTSPAQSYTS